MLLHLEIKDFTLVDQLKLEFGPGLNVLTGETGAGKSAVLAALSFALGERTTVDNIRTGAEKALVEAVFTTERWPAKLSEVGLEPEDYLVFRREFNRQGRSLCRINGQTLPVGLCRQVGEELVEFLGQGEARELYSSPYQQSLLDAFGGLEKLAGDLYGLYQEWSVVKGQLAQLEEAQKEQSWRRENLRYQVEEIERAALRPGEEEELLKEREWRRRSLELREMVQRAYDLLVAEGRAVEQVEEAEALLARLLSFRSDLEPYLPEMRRVASFLKDLAGYLRQLIEELESDPFRLEEVEERLGVIRRLSQKYRMGVEELLAFQQSAREELAQLEHSQDELVQLRSREKLLRQQWLKQAKQLQALREKAARHLERALLSQLSRMELRHARFQVVFHPLAEEQPHARGLTEVEFLFAPNPGEPLKPFARIASGGEAARTLLALKTLVAGDRGKTLCLDEVEAGIGGKALEAVAENLSVLARNYQLLCVTHQAVIAARADRHYLIWKEVERERTHIRADSLEGQARVKELARLIGGSRETAEVHACRLLRGRGEGGARSGAKGNL
ncbi:DNA repair protein RecN [Desulfothermobacter acidiphilus]|uniref:DNA repair protein RecN n=1 Tax=Desulfothermobacter acidiphilus TaxID=1938353 RepID=UPI003F896A0F